MNWCGSRWVALPCPEPYVGRWAPSPTATSSLQDPVPSRATRRRTPAQRLRDELRRLLGAGWSEELERDVPHAWQRHGDLVLLSDYSFKAAPWERLGKGELGLPSPVLPAPVLPAWPNISWDGVLQARSSGRRSPRLWGPGGWPGEDG